MKVWTDELNLKEAFKFANGLLFTFNTVNSDFIDLVIECCDLGRVCFSRGSIFTSFYEENFFILPKDESSLGKVSQIWHSVVQEIFTERATSYTKSQIEAIESYMDKERENFLKRNDIDIANVFTKAYESINNITPKISDIAGSPSLYRFRRYLIEESNFPVRLPSYIDLMLLPEFLEKDWHEKVYEAKFDELGKLKKLAKVKASKI